MTTSEVRRHSWTQPICEPCYAAFALGLRGEIVAPVRIALSERKIEDCCICGSETHEGIFVRVDPSKIPNPTHYKDD